MYALNIRGTDTRVRASGSFSHLMGFTGDLKPPCGKPVTRHSHLEVPLPENLRYDHHVIAYRKATR